MPDDDMFQKVLLISLLFYRHLPLLMSQAAFEDLLPSFLTAVDYQKGYNEFTLYY